MDFIPTYLLKTCSGVFSEIIANLEIFLSLKAAFPHTLRLPRFPLGLKILVYILASHQIIVLSQI